jgi:hypothetical protein
MYYTSFQKSKLIVATVGSTTEARASIVLLSIVGN